ncbi:MULTISPECIES: MFS transporter [unclassified Microbacterium]|uniref:MFS transporter n=1 Tax=unclassified Microbacterium TaxID=2609290 RepID=UPI00386D1DD6
MTSTTGGVPDVPATADSGALPVMFQDLEERPIPRKSVWSWAMWDWATQPFNSVILTFVFVSLFLVSDTFLPPEIAGLPDGDPVKESALAQLSSGYGLVSTLAGLAILLIAPILGQVADRRGRKKRWLLVATVLLGLVQFSLFFVHADPAYFWYGAVMVSVGAVVSEIAGVNYNALLVSVSTPRTIGKVSGLGWGLGYIGGILALVVVVVLTFVEWFGMDLSDGLAYRLIAVGCAVWTVAFAIPLFLNVPEPSAPAGPQPLGFFAWFREFFRSIRNLFRSHRSTAWFLLASAVYRDGLAGVFAFGGVLAAVAFGFSPNEVMIFGIAANLVAGISTIIGGRLDDRFGARAVIVTSLSGLVTVAVVVFALHDAGKLPFWIFGLALCAFVGPTQASTRSLLARVTPTHMQGEVFGLYATTGRVVSFLAPAMWTIFITAFGATYWGILGIAIVLALGLVLLLFVKLPRQPRVVAGA